MARWALKGTAHRFEHEPEATKDPGRARRGRTCEVLGAPPARCGSITFNSLNQDTVNDLLNCVPDLSHQWRTFSTELLRINHERLLNACRHR